MGADRVKPSGCQRTDSLHSEGPGTVKSSVTGMSGQELPPAAKAVCAGIGQAIGRGLEVMAAALGAKRNDDAPVTDSQGNTYSPVTAEWIRNLGRMR